MSSHRGFVFSRQHVKRRVFERMVTPGFENEGEIEKHVMIIPTLDDIRHATFGGSPNPLIKIYANSCCHFIRNMDNVCESPEFCF